MFGDRVSVTSLEGKRIEITQLISIVSGVPVLFTPNSTLLDRKRGAFDLSHEVFRKHVGKHLAHINYIYIARRHLLVVFENVNNGHVHNVCSRVRASVCEVLTREESGRATHGQPIQYVAFASRLADIVPGR